MPDSLLIFPPDLLCGYLFSGGHLVVLTQAFRWKLQRPSSVPCTLPGSRQVAFCQPQCAVPVSTQLPKVLIPSRCFCFLCIQDWSRSSGMSTVCLSDAVSHPSLLLNIAVSFSLYLVNIFCSGLWFVVVRGTCFVGEEVRGLLFTLLWLGPGAVPVKKKQVGSHVCPVLACGMRVLLAPGGVAPCLLAQMDVYSRLRCTHCSPSPQEEILQHWLVCQLFWGEEPRWEAGRWLYSCLQVLQDALSPLYVYISLCSCPFLLRVSLLPVGARRWQWGQGERGVERSKYRVRAELRCSSWWPWTAQSLCVQAWMTLSLHKYMLPRLQWGGSGDPGLFPNMGSLPDCGRWDPGNSCQLPSASQNLMWGREGAGVRSGCWVKHDDKSLGSVRAALCQSPLYAAGERAPGPSFHLLPNELRQGITIKGGGEGKARSEETVSFINVVAECVAVDKCIELML